MLALASLVGCAQNERSVDKSAAEILGNPAYLAISYSGYRQNSKDIQPTVEELKEDLEILAAMGIRIIRMYDVTSQHAPNVLKAIRELKETDAGFEMYVMLGAWIDCLDARTEAPNHEMDSEANAAEIDRAVALAKTYPNIVKMIAVGNEAMVHWQAGYYVRPHIILGWVNHLQELKRQGELSKDLWITSSDNFASWGGGGAEYHAPELDALIRAVDFISMHTYPMHDTYYNPAFWVVPEAEAARSDAQKIEAAMLRAKAYAQRQYQAVSNYVKSLGMDKPIHIGETGWATVSNGHYGPEVSRAADEYKSGVFYKHMREWTREEKISCFYFEAFDECWKDSLNQNGSENHFGLINLKGEAKYALWDLVDSGVFEGLTRDGQTITKTYNGDIEALMETVWVTPMADEMVGHQ